MQSASQTSSAETESNENLEDPRSSNPEWVCDLSGHGKPKPAAEEPGQVPSGNVECCKEAAFFVAKDR